MKLIVRSAREDDSEFFYKVRTIPQYQKYFLSSLSSTFEEHDQWFLERLNHGLDLMFVACNSCNRIGYVRFEPVECFPAFEISFALLPGALRNACSVPMIKDALTRFAETLGPDASAFVIARILSDNISSLKAVKRVGFKELFDAENLCRSEEMCSVAHVFSYGLLLN